MRPLPLTHINTRALVTRYNEALSALGLEPTALKSFHIDAVGYSPDIAEEKNPFYLSQGPANPLGVILTPNQQKSPLQAPVASFYRPLLAEYFQRFRREIADITRDTAIWLDFDQGVSQYKSPQNLLLLSGVSVYSGSGSLSEAAAEQNRLVSRFQSEELAWFDPAFRQMLIDNVKAHGDLRARYLVIPEFRYSDVSSFHSPAFGGAFVLRAPSGNAYLILEDKASYDALKTKGNALYLRDPELIEQLYAENLIGLDMENYAANLSKLRYAYDYLLAELLFDNEPELDFSHLTAPQRRQRLRLSKEEVPDTLLELEYLIGKLAAGTKVKASQLSGELIRTLLQVNPDLEPTTKEVVLQLLVRLEPRDVKRLYRADKPLFWTAYESWPPGKQRWAKELIGEADAPPR